jgi:RHS repeat-associated protein
VRSGSCEDGSTAAGRLSTVTNPAAKRISYSVDGIGQRTRIIEPGGGRFSYFYDAAGRTDHLINPQAQRTSWAYDDANRVTASRLANGARASYVYDDANELLRVVNFTPAGVTISSFAYKYDPAGNRIRVVEANGDQVTWSYDNAYQLTREIRSGANAYAITYSYDPVGNRLTKRDGGAPTTYAYDASNQVQTTQDSTGTTNYSFDANGNQTRTIDPTGARTSWSWDFENRLTGVRLPAGVPNTFTYNADDKRVQKQDSSGTAKAIWDLESILVETDQNDVTQVIYTLAPEAYGPLVSQFRSAATNFYHFDGPGSTDRLTDINQAVTDNYLYVAFGTIRTSTVTTTNPYRYVGRAGYYYDPDLLQMYLRARHYLPALGRFVSRDPIFLEAPELERLYVYARNNPLLMTDPSGLRVCHWIHQLGGPACDVPEFEQPNCFVLWLWPSKTACGFWDQADGLFGLLFSVRATFLGMCRCCEYRQCVKRFSPARKWKSGQAGPWQGTWIPFFKEDAVIEKRPPYRLKDYGHRFYRVNQVSDEYLPDRPTGCWYRNIDTPGNGDLEEVKASLKPGEGIEFHIRLSFQFHVKDYCFNPNANPCDITTSIIVQTRYNYVACDGYMTRDTVFKPAPPPDQI